MNAETDPHADIRAAVRGLCRQFPDAYFRRIDAERGYPEAFVDALTQAGWLVVHSGSEAQKRHYLPRIAAGALRLQSMGVTEPTTGSDTTRLRTTAVRKDGRTLIAAECISTNMVFGYVAEHVLGLPKSY